MYTYNANIPIETETKSKKARQYNLFCRHSADFPDSIIAQGNLDNIERAMAAEIDYCLTHGYHKGPSSTGEQVMVFDTQGIGETWRITYCIDKI